MSEIVVVRIPDNISEDIYNTLISCISPAKRIKINRFYNKVDAYRCLIGDLVIRCIACAQKNISNDKLVFSENLYGKPYLSGEWDFHFNLSHSGDWVTVIYGDSPVGIDVEQHKEIDIKFAEHFCTEREYLNLLSKNEYQQHLHFFTIWTLKESFIKALGQGLSIPLKSFSFDIALNEVMITSAIEGYFFKQYYLDSKHTLSACSSKNDLPSSYVMYDFRELCNAFISK